MIFSLALTLRCETMDMDLQHRLMCLFTTGSNHYTQHSQRDGQAEWPLTDHLSAWRQ